MSMTLQLDIVSDVVCPWCWLGKRRLDQTLALAPDLDVSVTWRPYELDPNVPKSGLPYRDYMRAKFEKAGGEDRFRPMRDYLEAAAPVVGIVFRFDEIAMRPNTLDAHRVIRWAQGQDKGSEMKEAIFRAYFDELRDIGMAGVLAEIAGDVGLDPDIVQDLLKTDRDIEAVKTEIAYFRKLGVQGVPTYIADGRLALPGAAEPRALLDFLREAVDEAA